MANWQQVLHSLPTGYTEGTYERRRYGISLTLFNEGRSLKLFAEELGGNDFISLNYYQTSKGEQLKPCELPVEKVMRFLEGVKLEVDVI
ncbi:MAG: peptide methionine sulfoxide reductase [Bacteroidota bacterium]